MSMLNEWKFSETIYGTVWHSLVDGDGDLIVAFFKTGLRFITPNKMTVLAPFGKGPNEIENFTAISFYKDGIAVLDHLRRAKVFPKIDEALNPRQLLLDLEKWQTSYSRITKAVTDNEQLILSVRTCSEN